MLVWFDGSPPSLAFMQAFADEALKDSCPPNPYLHSIVPVVLLQILDYDPDNDAVFELFVDSIKKAQKYYTRHSEIKGMNRPPLSAPDAMYIGPYIRYQYQRNGSVQTDDWFAERIEQAIENKNIDFFTLLFKDELPLTAIDYRHPQSALDALAVIFNKRKRNTDKRFDDKIDAMSISFLSRLSIYYSDEADIFLEECLASEEFKAELRKNRPAEEAEKLIGLRSWLVLRDEIIGGSSPMFVCFMNWFDEAVECKNLKEWMKILLHSVIDLVCGDKIPDQ